MIKLTANVLRIVFRLPSTEISVSWSQSEGAATGTAHIEAKERGYPIWAVMRNGIWGRRSGQRTQMG